MASDPTSIKFALEAAQMATWDWDIQTNQVEWSDNIEVVLGLSPGTFAKTSAAYYDLVYPEDQPLLTQAIRKALRGRKSRYHLEHRLRRPDGSIRWLIVRGKVERNETGWATRMAGILTDITIRKTTELAFSRRVTELQTVAEVSSAAATILDPAELLPEVVQLTQHRFGLYHVHIFLHEAENSTLSIAACGWAKDSPHRGTHEKRSIPLNHKQSVVVQAALTRQPVVVNNVHTHNNWLANPALPDTQSELAVPMIVGETLIGILDAQSEQIDYFTPETVSVYTTLASQIAIAIQNARLHSQANNTLTQLEAAIQELEKKNAELERFTYTVSHDLKSPLITMRGFLGFLKQDAESGNMTRFQNDLGRIVDATNKMQRLLEDLLELSRIGRIINTPLVIPFETIAWEAVAQVTGRIVERGVQVNVMADLPLVKVDQQRMVEAVQNLVDNAAKFMGDQPHPVIEIGTYQDGEKTVFYVGDNGIGIDPRYHDKIFGLFDKLDAQSEGTGVGLSLVKRIIEIHGGKIWVQSDGINRGTRFCFTLPAGTA